MDGLADALSYIGVGGGEEPEQLRDSPPPFK